MREIDKFDGKDFKYLYMSNLVYVWRRGSEVLYVGSAGHGFQRIAGHRVFRKGFIEDTDTITIHYFGDSRETCLEVERTLIEEYRPKYNGTQGPRNTRHRDYLDKVLPVGDVFDKLVRDVKRFQK